MTTESMHKKEDKGFFKEALFMGLVLIIVACAGIWFVFFKSNANGELRIVDHNAKRYDEGSLHFVADDLVHFKRIKEFKTSFKKVWSILLGSNGEIHISGNDGIRSYTSEGVESRFIPTEASVRFLASDEEGKLYACMENKIQVFDANGGSQGVLQHSKWGIVNAMSIYDGFLYVADRTNRLVWKCKLDGTPIDQFGKPDLDLKNGFIIPGPHMDMSWGPDGLLYVTNPGRHHVNAYTPEGTLKIVIGRPSFKHEGFCGCCNPVAMTVMKNGHVITTEKGIARVKVLDKDGTLVSVIAPPKDFKSQKHSYVIDVQETEAGEIVLLENGLNQVSIYARKKS